MLKWQQQLEESKREQKTFIEFDTKRKVGQNKVDMEVDQSILRKNDQQQLFVERQNESLLKRVILLEQRTRDIEELNNNNQRMNKRFEVIEDRLNEIFDWAQNQEQGGIMNDVQQKMIGMEKQRQEILKQIQIDTQSIVQSELQNFQDVNVANFNSIQIINVHEEQFKEMIKNQNELKQDIEDILQKQQQQSIKVTDEQNLKENNNISSYEQLKKAKSLLNYQKQDISQSMEKYQQKANNMQGRQIEEYQIEDVQPSSKEIQEENEQHRYFDGCDILNKKKVSQPVNVGKLSSMQGKRKIEIGQSIYQSVDSNITKYDKQLVLLII